MVWPQLCGVVGRDCTAAEKTDFVAFLTGGR